MRCQIMGRLSLTTRMTSQNFRFFLFLRVTVISSAPNGKTISKCIRLKNSPYFSLWSHCYLATRVPVFACTVVRPFWCNCLTNGLHLPSFIQPRTSASLCGTAAGDVTHWSSKPENIVASHYCFTSVIILCSFTLSCYECTRYRQCILAVIYLFLFCFVATLCVNKDVYITECTTTMGKHVAKFEQKLLNSQNLFCKCTVWVKISSPP